MSVGLAVSGKSQGRSCAGLQLALARTAKHLYEPHGQGLGVQLGVGLVLHHDEPHVPQWLTGLHGYLTRDAAYRKCNEPCLLGMSNEAA